MVSAQAEDVDYVKSLIEASAQQRSTGSTAANADSSRSHSIMQVRSGRQHMHAWLNKQWACLHVCVRARRARGAAAQPVYICMLYSRLIATHSH